MKQRGVTLIHTLVLLFSGMIAAGGVAAFASFSYHAVASTEMSTRAQLALEGAIAEAKYDIWNGTFLAGDKREYKLDDQSIVVTLEDTNDITPSTWLATATSTIDFREYKWTSSIGLSKFPSAYGLNWILNPTNGHHYAVVRVRNGVTPATAEANARELVAPDGKQAYLATVTSAAEWEWIQKKVLPPLNGAEAIIGGVQLAGSKEPGEGWGWSNGEGWLYADWASGQPDNAGEGGDSYLRINHPAGKAQWSDAPDGNYTTYIVEAGDWVQWIYDPRSGHYYSFIPQAGLTWQQARDAAAAVGGPNGEPTYLASITSSYEQKFISETVMKQLPGTEDGWLGGYQDPGSAEPDKAWKWVSGEPWGFRNWATGEPNNFEPQGDNEEDALHMFSGGTWNDLWTNPNALWGNVPGYFIEAGKPVDWKFNSSTGRWYAVVPAPGGLSWAEANQWASELVGPNEKAGYLATLTSQPESDFVNSLAETAVDEKGQSLNIDWGWALAGPYIGLRQPTGSAEPKGDWTWATPEPLSWTNWSNGQPDNWNNLEHFGQLVKVGSTWLWNDVPDATNLKSFVVEAGDNYLKWVQNPSNGNWYIYIPKSSGITWSQAKAEVATLVAPNGSTPYLATLTSRTEEAWVRSNVIPSDAPLFMSPASNAVAWIGLRQETSSWESKMGWTWDNGEGVSGYWSTFNFSPGTTTEPNESTGVSVATGTGEEYGWLSLFSNRTTTAWQNFTDSAGPQGYIAEAGSPSQMWVLQSQWRCQWDGTANFHPDSARYSYLASDFATGLGAYEWPVTTSTGRSRGLSDFDGTTNEWMIWSAGDRGSNRVISDDWSGPQTVPFDSATEESNPQVSFGRRQVHAKGTFFLADAAAVNSVQISMPTLDNQGFVWINGQCAFTHGQSLTNRALLKIGENRLDVFSLNWGGPGTISISCNVPIAPYARPLAQVHPFQYGLAVGGSFNLSGSPSLQVRGNVYAGGTVPTGFGAGSSTRGFWLNRSSGTPGGISTDYLLNSQAALPFPTFSPGTYASVASVTYGSDTAISNLTFSTPGAVHYSRGTLNISGHYTGTGVVVADTVNITGPLQPSTVTSKLAIVANTVVIGTNQAMDHRVGAFIYCGTLTISRPTILDGAAACTNLNMISGANSAFTVRHHDSLWRQRTLASQLRVPGYWAASRLTGTYYTYSNSGSTVMQDLTSGELTGGTLRETLGGRLSSNWRPLASPVGRTWHRPTVQMNQVSFPARELLWWTAGTNITQSLVRTDNFPINTTTATQGVWWSGGFDMTSAADIANLTMTITSADDMAVVYINGRLAIDHGGKHSSSWAGPTLIDKSMISVGSNRIDIFTADLFLNGGMNFTSNANFYPTAPTITSPTTADRAYNFGLYVQNGFNINANFDLFGDVMAGTVNRNSGTSRIRGLAWTSGSWPTSITYDSPRISSSAIHTYPDPPVISEYSSRAHATWTSDTMTGLTAPSASPYVVYRDGSLNLSGVISGNCVLVVRNNVFLTGNVTLASASSSLTVIAYDSFTVNSGTGSVSIAGSILTGTALFNRATTITGNLWARSMNQNAALTIYHSGRHFYHPENWARSYLPGFLP